MRKLFLSVSILLVVFLIFSCTKSFEPRLRDVTLNLSIKGAVADQYEVVISGKDGVIFSSKFTISTPVVKIPELQPGDYEILVRALKSGTVVAEGKTAVTINSSTLSTEIFVTDVNFELNVDYLARTEKFKVTQDGSTLTFEFDQDSSAEYRVYAYTKDNAWIPLNNGNPVNSGYTVTLEDGDRIYFNEKKTKYINYSDIIVFGIEVKKDGKTSGIAPAPVILDSYPTGGPVRSSAAVLSVGTSTEYAFIASDDGKLYAFRISNNKLEKVDEISVNARGLTSPLVDTSSSTPVLYFGGSDGTVFRIYFNTKTNKFEYDLDKDSYKVSARVEASPIKIGNVVVFATYDGKLWAFNVNTQQYPKLSDSYAQVLVRTNTDKILSSPIAVGTGIYFPFTVVEGDKAELWFARATTDGSSVNLNVATWKIGESYFRGADGNKAAVAGSPAFDGTAIYFATTEGVIVKVKDYETTPNFETKFLGLGRIDSSPIISNGSLYIGTDAGYVVCLDTGNLEIKWKYYTGNDVRGSRDAVRSTPLLSSNNTLYIGSYEGYIYAFNAEDGKLIWRYQALDRVWSSPALGKKKLIIGSSDNRVYLIRVADEELADGWSKWRKDNLNQAMGN